MRHKFKYLLVVAIVEGAVCNSKIGLEIVSVGVLPVALEKGQSCDEVSLLQVMVSIGQFELFLLLLNNGSHWLGLSFDCRSRSQHI